VQVGETRFYGDLFMVGLLYHLYNQFAFNTLQRVSPVSHGVCNVVKRIVIIFSSVLFFNQVMTQQAIIGTVIALAGTWLYTDLSSKHKHKKPEAGGGGKPATA
jgi:drug/metabolite transporter (DMT)-like permease